MTLIVKFEQDGEAFAFEIVSDTRVKVSNNVSQYRADLLIVNTDTTLTQSQSKKDML